MGKIGKFSLIQILFWQRRPWCATTPANHSESANLIPQIWEDASIRKKIKSVAWLWSFKTSNGLLQYSNLVVEVFLWYLTLSWLGNWKLYCNALGRWIFRKNESNSFIFFLKINLSVVWINDYASDTSRPLLVPLYSNYRHLLNITTCFQHHDMHVIIPYSDKFQSLQCLLKQSTNQHSLHSAVSQPFQKDLKQMSWFSFNFFSFWLPEWSM